MNLPHGLLEYFGAHDVWLASFAAGCANRFGEWTCQAFGKTPDQAILACLKSAEADFSLHTAVRFEAYKITDGLSIPTSPLLSESLRTARAQS